MQAHGKPTGFVRLVQLKRGPIFYAQLRLSDGSRPQRKLGKAWLKRSRSPAGYITRQQAEAQLEVMLAGQDPSVVVATGATFGQACDEWLRYVEHDRKRRYSTVKDYRGAINHRLLPEFGADTSLEAITVERVDAFRAGLVGELSDRTVNKLVVMLNGIFKRAQRAYGLAANPAAMVERQPQRRSGDFDVLDPGESR
jgi:Phage integrase, N-terminal SAM-like domain